jgi:hypothetical protein
MASNILILSTNFNFMIMDIRKVNRLSHKHIVEILWQKDYGNPNSKPKESRQQNDQ